MDDSSTLAPAAIIIALYLIALTVATYVIKHTTHLTPLQRNTR